MNTQIKLPLTALTVFAALFAGMANAGEVTGLTSFTSGSKAVASEVNGNFNAIKNAVNDNNSRIAAMQAEHVAYVSPSGGNYADPVAAMDDLAKWCGTPSATNLCLLKIMPGVYDLGAPLQMQSFVDIEGSGENVTHVNSNVDNTGNTGVVVGAANAELRDLTVEHNGTSGYATAIYIQNPGAGSFSLRRITVLVPGNSLFLSKGVSTLNTYLNASDLTVRINGNDAAYSIGVTIGGGYAELENVNVYQSGSSSNPRRGIVASSNTYVKMRNSSVNSTVAAVSSSGAYLEVDYTSLIGTTLLEGTSPVLLMRHNTVYGAISGTGSKTCVASYNGSTGGILGFSTCL